MDPRLVAGAAGAAALAGWALWAVARGRASALGARVRELEQELRAVKEADQRWESRIERYELLWFPIVTYSPARGQAVCVAAGVPYCRACVKPLALDNGEWACAGCRGRHPESVADLMIVDMIGQEALKQFLQRYPGFLPPAKTR